VHRHRAGSCRRAGHPCPPRPLGRLRAARRRPTPRPPHSRSARLSPSLDAAPDTPGAPRPTAAPLRTLLDREPTVAQDGSGLQGDRGADARLRPSEAGSRGGRPHFAHPGCASDVCAPQRALDRQARDDESKFKSRQQTWPSSPDAGFPGQAASLRGGETFVVPPYCRKA
jgi:hypothetical protein